MYKNNKTKGFTLIELILVISVGLTISFLSFKQMVLQHESQEAKIAGQQIKKIGDAANNYITAHYEELSLLKSSTGSATDPGPRNCVVASNTCSITLQTLSNEGFLPASFSDTNIFNSGYSINLKRSGVAPYYVISGIVITNNSWIKEGSTPRYDLLGKSMQEAGLDSGTTRDSNNVVNGYNGNWNITNSEYPVINKRGLLAYQVGYSTYSYSAYLRRDGTLPMTGMLNMNNKDIVAANNITASGTISTDNGTNNVTLNGSTGNISASGTIYSKNNITTDAWVVAKNGYGDVISFGGDASGDDYEIRTESDSRGLSLYSPFLPLTSSVLKVSSSVWDKSTNTLISSTGINFDLKKSGDLMLAGNLTSKKEITATNGYGDTVTIGGNAFGADYEMKLNSNKPMAVWGPNTPDTSPLFQISSSTLGNPKNIQMYGSGNIVATGNIQASTFKPTLISTIGVACPTNGTISTDAQGNILSCVNSKWSSNNLSGLSDFGGVVFPDGLKMIWGTSTPGTTYIQGNGAITWFESDGIDITPSFVKDGITYTISNVISWQASAVDLSGFGYQENFWCRRDVINKLRCWSGSNVNGLTISGKYLIIGY